MQMLVNIALKIILNTGAMWLAVRYVPGVHVSPLDLLRIPYIPIDPLVLTFLAAGIALTIVNALLYPILKVIAALLPFITTPMLVVVLNGVLLTAASLFLPSIFAVEGLKSSFLFGLLLGIVNSLL